MADHLALFNTLWYLQKALSWLKPTTRSTLQTVRLPGHKIAPVIKVKAFCQVRLRKTAENLDIYCWNSGGNVIIFVRFDRFKDKACLGVPFYFKGTKAQSAPERLAAGG